MEVLLKGHSVITVLGEESTMHEGGANPGASGQVSNRHSVLDLQFEKPLIHVFFINF